MRSSRNLGLYKQYTLEGVFNKFHTINYHLKECVASATHKRGCVCVAIYTKILLIYITVQQVSNNSVTHKRGCVQQVTHQPLATIYHAPSAPLWVSWLWLVAQIYIENIFVYLEHIHNVVCDHLSSLIILLLWQQDNYLS